MSQCSETMADIPTSNLSDQNQFVLVVSYESLLVQQVYHTKLKSLGALGACVVKNALQICSNSQMHSLFLDNFFSSYQLLCDITIQGFRNTGLCVMIGS